MSSAEASFRDSLRAFNATSSPQTQAPFNFFSNSSQADPEAQVFKNMLTNCRKAFWVEYQTELRQLLDLLE